jgi:hypothetical protein
MTPPSETIICFFYWDLPWLCHQKPNICNSDTNCAASRCIYIATGTYVWGANNSVTRNLFIYRIVTWMYVGAGAYWECWSFRGKLSVE